MLAGELTTLALGWRIERRDGVTLGLTSHDRDLMIDGLLHRAAPGMTPSAIKRGAGLDVDTMDAAGVLSDTAIAARDLASGRFDGARVAIFAVDWENPGEAVPLGEGLVGAVETRDGAFTAELRGPGAALARAVVEETSPTCRAELGDKRCRVALGGRRRRARIVSTEANMLRLDTGEPGANAYGEGCLRWLTGVNTGLESAIASSAGADLMLRAEPLFVPAPGDLVELTEGCDKTIATCANRFVNAVNFQGEPFLPGIDLLTRYPGG